MSTPAAALARRALACEGWHWMPGMRDMCDGGRFLAMADGGFLWSSPGSRYIARAHNNEGHTWLPDLSDPATLGCIEHGLLPEAGYADAHLDAFSGCDGETLWCVVYRPDPVSLPGQWLSAAEAGAPTKAEALVAALEAAL